MRPSANLALLATIVLILIGVIAMTVDSQVRLQAVTGQALDLAREVTAPGGAGPDHAAAVRRWEEVQDLQSRAAGTALFQVILIACLGGVTAWQMRALVRSHHRLVELTGNLERARDDADAANRGKSMLLANISHEIRTPMNGVIGLLSLAVGGPLPAREKEYIALAQRSAENLLVLINDILDYSKLEASRLDLEEEDFDLPRTIADVLALLSPKASEVCNVLQADIAPDVVAALRGDSLRIRQVMFNLLGNAIKFTRDGTITLRVRTEVAGDGSVILHGAVEDTGIGMSQEQQQRLFQRFSQVDTLAVRRFEGTGLGLAICRDLCELMGGGISAASTLGAGSTFSFHIRCARAMGEPAATAALVEQAAPDRTALRVLVVDDVEMNRFVLKEILERDGHHVGTAHNGQEALNAVLREPFDLVLMDVHMPVLDGFGAAAAIRELDGPAAGIPIVAVTANTSVAENGKWGTAGMNDVLAKPINRRALAETLRRFAPKAPVAPPLAGTEPQAPGPAVQEAGDDLLNPEQIGELREILDDATWTEAVDGFEQTASEMVGSLLAAARVGGPVRELAHAVKGVALNMGAQRLSVLALNIEKGSTDEAAAALDAIEDALGRTLAAMRAPVP